MAVRWKFSPTVKVVSPRSNWLDEKPRMALAVPLLTPMKLVLPSTTFVSRKYSFSFVAVIFALVTACTSAAMAVAVVAPALNVTV